MMRPNNKTPNARQRRFIKRHAARRQANWLAGILLIAITFGLVYIVANAALGAIDRRVCMQSTPDQFVKLHCDEVIK